MDNPIEWIRGESASFRALGSKIVRMQHNAALRSAKARAAGNADVAASERARVVRLGTLRTAHAAAVQKLDDLNALLAKVPGAGDHYLGILPAVPVAVMALAVALVATMGVVAYKVHVEEQSDAYAQRILGDGTTAVSPEQLAKLKAYTDALGKTRAAPGGDPVSNALTSMLKPLAIGLAVVVVGPKLLDIVTSRR